MNYLTHFYIDSKADNPYYNFGLALPDLINISKRGWRPDPNAFANASGNVKKIREGYKQHFRADAQFHNSELFLKQSKRLRKALEDNGFNQPGIRLFFVGHVLLEMMLDRHIVINAKTVADNFYRDLEQIDQKDIELFFETAGTKIPERFMEFFDRFRESKYLYTYADAEGIFFAMNRLLKRTGQPGFDPALEKSFIGFVAKQEMEMLVEMEDFLQLKSVVRDNQRTILNFEV